MRCLIFGIAIAAVIGIWTDTTRAGADYGQSSAAPNPATYR